MSLVGHTIGNYKVVQQIGEGGMGVVYLAEHPVIGRKVAIKLLHTSFANDADTVARFFNEARAIHLIRHHNIVEILDFGQTNDRQPYFIMEFLVGESLADRIARGPIPPAEAVAIVSQICDALQAAHDKNIVHRDLKPHNVFLVGTLTSPDVKILDFGVAKMTTGWGDATQSGGQSVKTRTGSLMGTPLYMSPEQCRGSGKLDHRTDIYSLAVILFEMISGRPPFTAEGVGELFAKHMLEPPPSLATFAPGTPPHIVAAVARALSKDLEDRFPDMKSLRAALNAEEDALPAAPAMGAGRPRIGPSDARASRAPPAVTNPSTMAGVQSTTLSSSVSELDDSLDALDGLGLMGRRRRGFLLGLLGAAALAGIGVVVMRKSSSTPAPSAAAVSKPEAAFPSSGAGTGATATAPSTSMTTTTTTVHVRFDAEPSLTHVLRTPANAGAEPEDLGPVPVELTLPRSSDTRSYILRAEGHKDRVVRLDTTRDQSLHFTLERSAAVAEADKKPRLPERRTPPKPQARPQRRPALHDADGLAVPSF